MSQPTRAQLLTHLRDALNHLREPNYLRQSPLAAFFGVANRPDTPAALRRILIEAIRSLHPEPDEPAQSPAWRLYEALYYRYVQYSSQLEVADQLGISTRQLRREQRAAFETLAGQLWEQQVAAPASAEPAPGGDVATPTEDLAWLKDAPPQNPTDVARELPTVLDLARPLAAQHGVRLRPALDDGLAQVATDPIAFRQTLLSLLGVAISRAAGGSAHICARSQGQNVTIDLRAEGPKGLRPETAADAAGLNMARQLAGLCGGELALSADGDALSATLTLPALGQQVVLAIDDNAGTLHLLQRYAAGTRYRIVGTQDPDEALRLAEEHAPRVIVLDVMMPQTDGWQVLGRLRQHPLTSDIPIIVCTILTQRELALSLGASDFVRKPVTRQAFLAALDGQAAPTERGSR